jgi:hypothetical protein
MLKPAHLIPAALSAVLLMLLAPAAAAQDGRWFRAETPHFIVYSDAREAQVREVAVTLERFDTVLRTLIPPPRESPAKLEIYLLRRRDMLWRVSPDLPSDAAGFYTASPEIVAAFAAFRDAGGLESQEILFHEYAHHYMLHNFTQAYPGWYVEGFAEVVQTVEFRGDQAIIGRFSENRAAWLVSSSWLQMDRVLASHRQRFSRDETALFYAQSWLMTHYLMLNTGQNDPFLAYLSAIQSGGDTLEAFEPAFGMTPADFQRALRAYTRNDLPVYGLPVPASAVAAPQITRLSAAADRLLLIEARMRLDQGEEADAEFLQRAETTAAEFAGDAHAQRVLARAAIMRGAYQLARTVLEPLAGAESTDVEAHYLMGLSYVVEAAQGPGEQCAETARQSRRHFVRAHRLNGLHVANQYRYASSWQCDAEMPDTARDVLLNAYGLAPQVEEIRLNTAVALMQDGEFEEAARMIRSVVYSPHRRQPNEDDDLQDLLEAAERGELPVPTAPAQ